MIMMSHSEITNQETLPEVKWRSHQPSNLQATREKVY